MNNDSTAGQQDQKYLPSAFACGALFAITLVGDLYHYPEEITTGRTPSFEWNAEASKASRAAVQAFLKQSGAEMWIEHDRATNDKLPKSPKYIE